MTNVHPINTAIVFANLRVDDAIAVANRFAAGLVDDPPDAGRIACEIIARALAVDLRMRGVDDAELDPDLLLIRDWR